MSKKDFYSGAEIVGKASSDKFTEVSQKLGEIGKDFSDFSKKQIFINENIVDGMDSHGERLQALEDDRNFVSISRHSLEYMEPHEQEFLAGWFQDLVLALKEKGVISNSNQQEFLANLFKFIGIRDVLMLHRDGLEALERFGCSGFHEAVYKVFLIYCYLNSNNFDLLEKLEDIDQMFKLNAADKINLKKLLENERIPTLGVQGLVGIFDQTRALSSFSVEALISRHLEISTHSLLRFDLDKESYSTYLKAFAFLVPQSGQFTEKQRSFISALAVLFDCPEVVFELDQLCANPQNIDIRAWQNLLDTDDKKYAWALDASALLGLNPDFDPEKDDVLELVLKGVKLLDTRDFLIASTQLTRETNPVELYEQVKIVNKRCNGWKHIIEYCGLSFNKAFEDLKSRLNRYFFETAQLSIEGGVLSMDTLDNRYVFDFDYGGVVQKVRSAIGNKAMQISRAFNVSELRKFKKKVEENLSSGRDVIYEANAVLGVFGIDRIDFPHWYIDDSDFEIDNSISNEDWGDDYDFLHEQLESALQRAMNTTSSLISQLEFFEKGELSESILVRENKEKEAQAKKRQDELDAKRFITVGEGSSRQVVSLNWKDIKSLPFKAEDISQIVSSGSGWMLVVNGDELFYSEDGEDWSAVTLPVTEPYLNISLKYVHDTWILIISSTEMYFSTDGQTWLNLNLPDKHDSYKHNILFFDGQWLFLSVEDCEYSYTEKKKGLIWDSVVTESSSYDAPVFYRSESLQGPWERWDEASRLSSGLTLELESIKVHGNMLVAFFEYDYFYKSRKNKRLEKSRILYITPQGSWKSVTWPADKIEKSRGKFYSWGKSSIYFDGGTIISSKNGYEWAVITEDLLGDELLETNGFLFSPGWGGKTGHISNDGVEFIEIALSEASDSGNWSHFSSTNKAILAIFSPSNHETYLRMGTIQEV